MNEIILGYNYCCILYIKEDSYKMLNAIEILEKKITQK